MRFRLPIGCSLRIIEPRAVALCTAFHLLYSLLPCEYRHIFARRCTGAGVEVEVEGGARVRAKALIGADGVRSVVASYLQLPPPSYSGYIGYR